MLCFPFVSKCHMIPHGLLEPREFVYSRDRLDRDAKFKVISPI